ncbi:hypothetical protein B0H13DRAFT_2246570 [Mycena leptocephala]|nr:hypothetical protein B0H13DRAFT_2246570 [Mycena leptocephala]
MSFTNVYYKRSARLGVDRRDPQALLVCYKPTTTVLATINTSISCTPARTTSSIQALQPGGHWKVVAEWEDRQKRKKEKEKADKEKADKEKADKDKEKDKDSKDKDKAKDTKDKDEDSPKIPGSLSPKSTSTPTHERFTLHRDMFTMRQGEHRKRRQTAQAKDLAPRLPGAPRGTL